MISGLCEILQPCMAEAVLALGIVALLLLSRLPVLEERAGDLALLVVAASCVGAVVSMDAVPDFVAGRWIVSDPFAAFFKLALSMAALATCWLATRGRGDEKRAGALSWVLFVGSVLAADVAVASVNAAATAVAFFTSTSSAALWVAARRDHVRAGEQGLALLWQGSAAASLALFGFALLFALGGSVEYGALAGKLPLSLAAPGARTVLAAALVLVIAGFGFSTAMLPWASWRTSIAGTASLPVLAWLQTGWTLTGLAIVTRVLRCAVSATGGDGSWTALAGSNWPALVSLAAAATIAVANIAALRESDLRKMLAWFSVAQTGYLLLGLAAPGDDALAAMLFHAVTSSVAVIGASATLAPVVEHAGSADLEAVRGLARRRGARPLAVALALFVLSLAAVPPLAGYEGRAALIAVVVAADRPLLALAAAVGGAAGLLCALRVIATLLDRPVDREETVPVDFEVVVLAGLLLAGVLALGFWPGALGGLAGRSVVFFGG